jgi:hypothetical protein
VVAIGRRVLAWRPAVVGVAVAAAACSGASPPGAAPATVSGSAPSGSAASTASAAPPASGPSIVTSGWAAVCTGQGFPDAPAYRGAGPHLIGVNVKATNDPATLLDRDLATDVGTLPAGWQGSAGTSLHLVACVRVIGVHRLRTCPYRRIVAGAGPTAFTASLFQRTLAITVRSTRTGQPIGSTVQVSTGNNACDTSVAVPAGTSATALHQYGTLTDGQLRAVLADRVQRTVP